jgi:hypothetical protein
MMGLPSDSCPFVCFVGKNLRFVFLCSFHAFCAFLRPSMDFELDTPHSHVPPAIPFACGRRLLDESSRLVRHSLGDGGSLGEG